MERINEFPLCVLGFTSLTSLKLDQAVFFPGNERHGIWSSPLLETVYITPKQAPGHVGAPGPPPIGNPTADPKGTKPTGPQQKSVAGRPATAPRN